MLQSRVITALIILVLPGPENDHIRSSRGGRDRINSSDSTMVWPAAEISGCSEITLQPVICFGTNSTPTLDITTDALK